MNGSTIAGLCAVLVAGCSVVVDLDRFEAVEDGGTAGSAGTSGKGGGGKGGGGADKDAGSGADDVSCANARTLCVQVKNFSPHLDELVQIDLVTNADNTLRARAILDPLGVGSPDAEIVMPLAIPESEVPEGNEKSPLHAEIYADQNKDGMYTLNEDHDWNVDLPGDGKLVFPHNSDFSALDPPPRGQGADFHISFSDMSVHIGSMLEIMVIQVLDETTRRTVGLYRLQEVSEDAFEIVIPDIIDPGNIAYVVEFYADANKNRKYDGPPTDHAWMRSGESGDDGLSITFKHAAEFMDLPFQFRFEAP